MNIILIAGLWLPKTVWIDVASHLEELGHRAIPLALPGADDGSAEATLEDQVAAVIDAVDAADNAVVVGHSAACTLAWIAADRRPEAISRVMLIGGFPAGAGDPYADFLPITDGLMPFPGWEPFEGPDSDDLSEAQRAEIESLAIPVPEGVARGVVRLDNEARFDVPVVLICPEFSPEQAKAWIDSGDVPEMANARHISFVDIDSGHWPMFTRPVELAQLIDKAARAE